MREARLNTPYFRSSASALRTTLQIPLYVEDNGMLYAFGSNGSGQLGTGGKEDTDTPAKCLFSAQHEMNAPPMQIAAGGNHTLLLLKLGVVYSVGSNVHGQLGHSSDRQSVENFQKIDLIPSNPRVKLCSASWEASVLVTTDDEVYTFGRGLKGELGTGNPVSSLPQKIADFPPSDINVVDIASCVNHTVAVLSNGDIYGWGDGRKGQLGEAREIVWRPIKIPNPGFRVLRALCGKDFTYLVGEPSQGHHIILGTDKWKIRSSAPAENFDWKSIGESWGSLFALKRNGKIESWGRSDLGQLPPKNLPEIDHMATGSEHVLALTKSGQIISWGWGEHGNCGPETDQMGLVKDRWNEIFFIPPIESEGPQIIAAGCATSFVWI